MCKNLLQGVRTMLRRNTPQRTGLRGVRTTYELVTAQAVNLKLGKIREDREFLEFPVSLFGLVKLNGLN